ncbi:hypothetical protein BKN67_11250 [Salmonella enterica]|nr:hypothetical protein [Salmonella enterica]
MDVVSVRINGLLTVRRGYAAFKKIVLPLILGMIVATASTPAMALVCLASHPAKECAEACGVVMWFMFPICL